MIESAFSAADHTHMAHALRLAERGLATTQPNPRVGCVIVRGGEVVGEGWHRRAGGPHAEVFALRAAGERARGATAYVTLEPCGLYGRTPPCADALIAAGIARVVIASGDAFQREGGAIPRLRQAGIAVDSGLLHAAARDLNRGFFSRVERGRPWVRLKLATSLDGRTALANGDSKWITGEAARADVQHWRARSSAILTGSGTVLADDPRLTVRLEPGPRRARGLEPENDVVPADAGSGVAPAGPKETDSRFRGDDVDPTRRSCEDGSGGGEPLLSSPLRVVLDRGLRTPAAAHVLDDTAPTLVFHAPGVHPPHAGFGHAELFAVETRDGRLDLAQVLAELGRRGVNELQVEAGPTLCGALFAAGLVDELLLYVAPLFLGDAARPLLALPALNDMAARWRLRVLEQRQVGDDWRSLLRPSNPAE